MSIKNTYFNDANELLNYLIKLSMSDSYMFRGHTDKEYKLQTTWNRHFNSITEDWDNSIDVILNNFRVGLAKLDMLPFENKNRIDWMEYARHFNLPMPVIDFTYSPLIALFFAFNNISINYKNNDFSVIYAIHIRNLAWFAATYKLNLNEKNNFQIAQQNFKSFLNFDKKDFKNNFPLEKLLLIQEPGKYNRRMQKQQGLLLYDTLLYDEKECLDDLIENYEEPTEDETNKKIHTIEKIHINKNIRSEVLKLLEFANISAAELYGTAEGVAMDTINGYSYIQNNRLRELKSF